MDPEHSPSSQAHIHTQGQFKVNTCYVFNWNLGRNQENHQRIKPGTLELQAGGLDCGKIHFINCFLKHLLWATIKHDSVLSAG